MQGFWKKNAEMEVVFNRCWVFREARGLSPVLLYSLLYLASIDDEGNISKPFLLPQENPWQFYHSSVFSYNVPDFTCDKVEFDVNGAYDEVFCDKKQQATVR